MGKKSQASGHKNLAEKEDKHRPKSKAEKKLEHQQHQLKVGLLVCLLYLYNPTEIIQT